MAIYMYAPIKIQDNAFWKEFKNDFLCRGYLAIGKIYRIFTAAKIP